MPEEVATLLPSIGSVFARRFFQVGRTMYAPSSTTRNQKTPAARTIPPPSIECHFSTDAALQILLRPRRLTEVYCTAP